MSEEIPFAKSLLLKGYNLIMLDCSTRRSIISTVAFMQNKEFKEYTNKKWTVKYLGTKNYSVIDNSTGVRYFVVDYYDGWFGERGFGVYKKEEKK